jgi:hypothetical protein
MLLSDRPMLQGILWNRVGSIPGSCFTAPQISPARSQPGALPSDRLTHWFAVSLVAYLRTICGLRTLCFSRRLAFRVE